MTPRRHVLSWSNIVAATAVVVLVFVGTVVGALAAGYRPVVIQTGSMGDTAPPGTLIVAAPVDASQIDAGDILVMRRPGATPVTHRVIEVEREGTARFAITQGDANEAPDAAPYPLEGEQLVSRWIVPSVGGWIQTAFQPGLALAVVALATVVIAIGMLRRIWETPPPPIGSTSAPAYTLEPVLQALPAPVPVSTVRTRRRRRRMAVAAAPLLVVSTVGVAYALFQSSELVASNDFSTAACFDPQLTSVQSGETIHAVNGTVTVPITAVDPTAAFVMASLRSNANEPADSVVQVELTGGGTAVDLIRFTDAGSPPSVTVAWSVVEYGCGISVQRGTLNGDGTAQLDIPITTVDLSASFVLVTSAPDATATDFSANDLFTAELADPSTLRIRTTGSTFSIQRSFSWQVVTFDDPGDVSVQTTTATLGLGVASTSAPLGSPADPRSTFIIASATSAAAGPDIGERLVRTHLVDANTVSIDRSVAGDPVDVHLQVVTLKDGSIVRHGTVDFNPAQPARTVTFEPVDVTRSTAISTVAQPGATAGGMTDHVADDVPGEAGATFVLADAENVTITRDATSSAASFGWQVIEWAGPQWWDPNYTFRQRIDVDTAAVAAPDAYTVPLTFDHDALVTSGLSRSDGNDIRVLRWGGTAWTELDRVLDEGSAWNQTTTSLWFRTTDPIAADTTDSYWLYFGNNTPAAVADDPEGVYLLTEDFESGTLGDFEDRTGGTGWYVADPWTRRIPVTVPNGTVATDLNDFPLLVSLTSADLGANAQTDGSDIRFTAADGVTPLAHEIETWTPGSGVLSAWVQVPTVSAAANTTVHLYYGAADAPGQQDVRNVWPDEVEAAWHLGRDPSGSAPQLDDSSARNHDGLSAGAMTAGDLLAGRVGDAIDFDGADDVLEADPFDLGGATEFTISGWVRLDSLTGDASLLAKANGPLDRILQLAVTSGGAAHAYLSLDGASIQVATGTVTVGPWHHLAMTWDGANLRLFQNGAELASAATSGSIDVDPSMPVTIGNLVTADRPVDGQIDEVRVERTARSLAWLAAAEANQRNPGSFLSIGGVETGIWFDQGTWSYRKPVAVDADLIDADVSDFALLVQFTDTELQAGALASAADIVFTDSDGTTRLDHVIESYDGGTGSLTAWVLVPNLSSVADTELFAYYGNPTATDQQDPVGVFGPNADLASWERHEQITTVAFVTNP